MRRLSVLLGMSLNLDGRFLQIGLHSSHLIATNQYRLLSLGLREVVHKLGASGDLRWETSGRSLWSAMKHTGDCEGWGTNTAVMGNGLTGWQERCNDDRFSHKHLLLALSPVSQNVKKNINSHLFAKPFQGWGEAIHASYPFPGWDVLTQLLSFSRILRSLRLTFQLKRCGTCCSSEF